MVKAPKSAEQVELFQIDSTGDFSLRPKSSTSAAQGKLPKGFRSVPRPLTSTQILAQRSSKTPALYSKAQVSDVLITKKKNNKSNVVRPEVKRRLAAIARRDKSTSLKSFDASHDPSKTHDLTHAVKSAGTYDLWAASPKPSASTSSTSANMPPSIPIPNPGTSYNPSFTDHQKLLSIAHEEAVKEEERRKRFENQVPVMTSAENKKQSVQEMLQSLKDDLNKDNDNEEESDGDDDKNGNIYIKRGPTKRKTDREKRKRKQNLLLEARQRFERKVKTSQARSVHNITSILSSASQRELETKRIAAYKRARRLEKAAQVGLGSKYSGPARVPLPKVEYSLSEDLPEDLRHLKVQGNLFRDWEHSAMRRGIIPSRRRLGEIPRLSKQLKGKRTKEVEKHAWRHFEA